jgi:hypothetical protein
MDNKHPSEASASFNPKDHDGSIGSSIISDDESNATSSSSFTSVNESNAETFTTLIEDGSSLNSEDESYSEARSSLDSVPSDIRRGVFENGRVYAIYGQHG